MSDGLSGLLRAMVRAEVRAELAAQRAAPAPPRLLTVPEVCAALGGLSRGQLYKEMGNGLRTVHIGKRVFVAEAELRSYIESRGQAPMR
jgi:hypothetical protein